MTGAADSMKIAVVGGGPAGLFFARLAKRRYPGFEVDVIEQNPSNATYGFGVTLAGSARDRLREIDACVHDRLTAAMVFNDEQAIDLNGDRLLLRYATKGGAIARLELLNILEIFCRDVGVNIAHDQRLDRPEDLEDYDLVVGADGANSAVRGMWPQWFPMRERLLVNRFAWYGVKRALRPNALVFKEHGGGHFIAHYYAYTDTMSTFVAECDAEAWTKCGLDRMTDSERKQLVEQIFAKELEGEKLQENKSVWRRFNAQVTERWAHENVVLIGDALRVAHFSIGSGTRLAMDDAVALFEALEECGPDIPALRQRYVATRKPTRDLFTDATERSYEWYENIGAAMHADIVDFAHSFLTRTGRIDDRRLKNYAPEFYRDYIAPRLAKQTSEEAAQ